MEKKSIPVAELQRDLYSAVKRDPVLKHYPVFNVSEGGAQTENVGLQFLTIPKGAGTFFPRRREICRLCQRTQLRFWYHWRVREQPSVAGGR